MPEHSGQLLRNVLAIVGGVLIGTVVIFVVQSISHQIYPVASDIDYNDKEAMRSFVAGLPVGALLMVIASYVCGSFVAGMISAWVGRGARVRHALVAGVLLLLAGIMNLVSIPHPLWFSVVTVLVFIPAAWAGGKLAAR